MADTYEKDLGQKSSLTTSDFIRVVGSDNVSYKQGMASVMGAMGVDGLMMPSNIIPSGSTVETYANGLSKGFHLACNNSSSTATAQGAPFTCPCTYYITVYTVNEHIQIICQPWNPNVAKSKTLAVKTKYGGTWSDWTIMPTRAEVDALNSNSWSSATLNSEIATGIIRYARFGHLVIVEIQDVVFSSFPTGTGTTVASGLPAAAAPMVGIICSYSSSSTVRLAVNDTRIVAHYISASFAKTGQQHYGIIAYIAK